MEIGLEEGIPTYSGGLGILGGDTIRSAADMKVPMVAVTLLHRRGYFYQKFNNSGMQIEEPVHWPVDDYLKEIDIRAEVSIEDRKVRVRPWLYEVKGTNDFSVPVFFLDTDLPENSEFDRTLTHYLYGGDSYYRLCQEAILGIGGVRILRELSYNDINRFHMNEGHASLLTIALLEEYLEKEDRESISDEDIERVHAQCVFTTHTPVAAGHDKFPMEMTRKVLSGYKSFSIIEKIFAKSEINMTYLALNLSHYINGVAKKHGQTSSEMFRGYEIDSITNGVHAATWTSPPFQKLFDTYIPGWRKDNFSLRYAEAIPGDEIWSAHQEAKCELIQHINRETNAGMDHDVFTIGFARRVTRYKRPTLLFRDIKRLRAIAEKYGRLQIIYGGKAHPRDQIGKELIKEVYHVQEELGDNITITFVPNYDIEVAKLMVAGVDLWLNTPEPPMEASGTSGMKAALNGVPSLSILDGWWIEGCIEGVTGWAIESPEVNEPEKTNHSRDADSLYHKLEDVILPMFYKYRYRYIDVMQHTITLNGSFFNTQRMIQEYVLKAYFCTVCHKTIGKENTPPEKSHQTSSIL